MNHDIDDFLAHYGIKGMKWGVRRSQAELDHKAGRKSPSSRKKRGVKVKRPPKTSSGLSKSDKTALALLGASFMLRYGPALKTLATLTINTAVHKKMASNGAKAAAAMMADSRGLTNYSTVALAFDQATKTWR